MSSLPSSLQDKRIERSGICGVRENKEGVLYSQAYGKVIARAIDPIEKKLLFHFHPGSMAYSIATVGCNFRCNNCRNFDISQMPMKILDCVGPEDDQREKKKLLKSIFGDDTDIKIIHGFDELLKSIELHEFLSTYVQKALARPKGKKSKMLRTSFVPRRYIRDQPSGSSVEAVSHVLEIIFRFGDSILT